MSRFIILPLVCVLFFGGIASGGNKQGDLFERIYDLLDKKEYFRFKNTFEASKKDLAEWQVLYFEVINAGISNTPGRANDLAEVLMEKYGDVLADSLKKDILSSEISSRVHLFDYKGAMTASEELLGNYSQYLDEKEKEEYNNNLKLWQIAKDVPSQTINITSDSRIELLSSFAGKNIETIVNGDTNAFIFDTGANFSVIIKSLASDLRIRILPGDFKVTSITGEKLPAELGVADSLIIGNMIFNNVLFLVFPDEAFTFGPGLVIEGIIGFPVINAMKELRFSEDYIDVPKDPSKRSYSNLALDGFTPVIGMIEKNDTLCFGFDTGADKTMLYPPFYLNSKDEIEENHKLTKYKFGGAGGIIEVDAYLIETLLLKTGETQNNLKDTYVLISPLGEHSKYYYGNLGMDYIGAYETYIMNFEDMFIDFER
jgi:predicted aspartyl protease